MWNQHTIIGIVLSIDNKTRTYVPHGATPHVLRHSYLTYAVGITTDFKTIQGISGHADVFTLVNRYAHPQETKVINLTNEIAGILTNKLPNQESSNPL